MKKVLTKISCIIIALAVIFAGTFSGSTSAFDPVKDGERIRELDSLIDEYHKKATDLASQADTLANEIARLKNEQETIKKQIERTELERDQLILDIDVTQQRIDDNSNTIGLVIAQYYYNNDVSTIERLASSESFASFIDEEVRLTSISDTLAEIVEENKNLKAELVVKKQNAENLLADLATQKKTLSLKEAEQGYLLEQTKNDEAKYQQLKKEADSERENLLAQQREYNMQQAAQYDAQIVAGDSSKGGYPYAADCPWYQDAYADPWGMYVCECVSYAAWKVYQKNGYMYNWAGIGDARLWGSNARAVGIEVSDYPRVNSVGYSTGGWYGHVVWVEAVDEESHRVYVSQYNYGTPGEYSEMWIDWSAYSYIYF